jgi:hypothetical protein
VPGIGPIISTATVAAIGSGEAFPKGRDFGAWLGLVPRQMSTGGRTVLGPISKRGNRYLRMLFVQAARAVLLRPRAGRSMASNPGSRRQPGPQSVQASDRTRQQNRAHRLGCSPWRAQLRGQVDEARVPSRVSQKQSARDKEKRDVSAVILCPPRSAGKNKRWRNGLSSAFES